MFQGHGSADPVVGYSWGVTSSTWCVRGNIDYEPTLTLLSLQTTC